MLPVVLSANSQAGGYRIPNSLRFRSSASAYLSRTYTSSATWTLSLWGKRGILGAIKPILGSAIKFNANDTLTAGTLTTTAVYRDPSAWYHIVISNIGCYVNGISIGAVTTSALTNASIGSDGTNYFDGYLADINFIDGQALDPTSFGAFDATTGVWTPKSYSGTYGTNGFHLNFSNGTSTTTLGYDSSPNGNNWTTNNISLTAGSAYDWMIDSPTPYQGASYGVGNYAVLNPLYAYSSLTLSGANLNIASSANYRSGMASFGMSSGKWYWEYVVTAVGNDTILGISSNPSVTIASYPGNDVLSWGYEAQVGNKYNNGSFSAYGATYTTNDVIGVAFDADAGSLTFYKNGVSQGVAYSSLANNTYYAAFGLGVSSTGSANFGQRPFAYTPPSGYKSLCTYNLPTPTIQNGAGHMAATTYTGTGATQTLSNAVNSVSFQPDLVWTKARSAAIAGLMYDSVRGTTKYLQTNSTAAEGTGADSLTAFNANGFSVGADTSTTGVNQNGTTYVAWQWKAGGTAVTNNAGSITSSVSANTTSGFSVVTFTAQTSGTGTVGHGLGVAPSMIITKSRNNISGWPVYHISTGNTGYLNLTTTGAFVTDSTVWNNTNPTTSVFQSGSVWAGPTQNIVAYCFAAIAGYSAFGSYTGNGSADGPFVYCGFRPRYVLVKSASAGYWDVIDTSRDPYNGSYHELFPNSNDAEYTGGRYTDILSNGFKQRTSAYANVNGEIYIYACFAENPFQLSLAR